MSLLIACPECQQSLQLPEELVGSSVQCPGCKQIFTATAPAEAASSQRASRAVPELKTWKEYDAPRKSERRFSRRDDGDDADADLVDEPIGGRFRCPFCGSRAIPVRRAQISAAGWVVFVVMLLFCLPLFWLGLLITEEYRVCHDCGSRIGG